MYDNIRHKLTLAFIIIMTLISCFAGETWPMWVGSDWIWESAHFECRRQ